MIDGSRRLRHHKSPLTPLVVAVALLTLTAGCSDGGRITLGPPASTTTPSSSDGEQPKTTGGTAPTASDATIKWGTCRGVDIAIDKSVRQAAVKAGMECGDIEVPVDHDTAGSDEITLMAARLPATGPAKERLGSLIVNPGGPGGSGLEFIASSSLGLPAALRKHFDVVSFDPRGIGASTPLDCLTKKRRKEIIESETPDDPAEQVAESVAVEEEIADGCRSANEDLAANMGTDEVVDDLDDLRAAVGDDQLTYLGLSYGTRIGAVYATRYPDKVRAIVLDGSVSPSPNLVEMQGGQAKGIIRALDGFVTRCNADASCPLGPDAATRLDTIGIALDADPITIPGDGDAEDEVLDKDLFVTGVMTAFYDPSTSSALAEAAAALDGSDAAKRQTGAKFIAGLAGLQSGQEPDGSYGNGFETQSVVNCLDADSPLEGDELAQVRALAGPIPALLDSDPAADSPSCAALPTGDSLEIGPSAATGRILIVGTEGDPATPIEWTRAMTAALGNPAVITYAGNGHTASTRQACVTDQVAEFFDTGTVPAGLADCPQDPLEFDIYAQLAKQLDAMGLGDGVGQCIADELRTTIDPLGIVGMNSDDVDPGLMRDLQSAALSCR